MADNAMKVCIPLAEEGWGMSALLEHELTDDGRIVGLARWSRSWEGAAIWEEQAGANLLFYDLGLIGTNNTDVFGIGFNWVSGLGDLRDEYNLETFYRFPVVPGVDTTFSYQSVFDPAYNTEFDHAHVFTLRIRTTF